MAKDPTDPLRPAGARANRQKNVTIDLPAEEVKRASTAAEPDAIATPSASAAAPKTPSETAAPADTAPPSSTNQTKRETTGGEETVIPSAFATQSPGGNARIDETADAAEQRHAPSRGILIAAAAAGAALVGVGLVLLLSSGILAIAGSGNPDAAELAALKSEIEALREQTGGSELSPLRDQMAALEQSMAELRTARSGSAQDAALEEMQTRLATLENLAAGENAPAADPAVDARLSELAAEIDALKSAGAGGGDEFAASLAALEENVAALSERVDAAPSDERLVALEAEVRTAREEAATAASLAPAVAADALAAALEAGRPFTAELGAVAALGLDEEARALLEPHAEAGLATLAELQAGFEAAIASVDLSTPIAEGTGAIDRLLQSARGLVDVRPARPAEGADPAAVVTRIRAALAAGDLETALAEWNTLPEEIKAAGADWAADVKARSRADSLVARLRADALTRLSQTE